MTRRGAVVVAAHPGHGTCAVAAGGRARAAVVRPDRTVLCASRDLAKVCRAVPIFGHPQTPALMRRPAAVPAYEPDLYSARAILDPYPHYARLRRLGPVVWLSRQRVYALPRYAECKAVLRDDTTFLSGEGVGLNGFFNRLSRGTTLNSDGDQHDQRRKLVAHRLLPRALRTMSDTVNHQAEQLVAAAVHVNVGRGQRSGDRAATFRGARSRRLA